MIAGGCHCGAVRYTLAIDDLPAIYCCHCLKCQSWAGSAFTEQAPVAEDKLSVEGPVAEYSFTNPSGSTSHQRVCSTCHTRIYNTNSARPGLAMVRAGTLDRSNELVPRGHIWVKRKQPWVVIADDVPQWPESAPMAEFAALMLRP
jgi:hypothetical protein